MRKETRATREILNESGAISIPGGSIPGGSIPGELTVEVHFDLVELQDFIDGTADRKYSYGRLRFREQLAPEIVSLFLSSSHVVLTGGGFEIPLCLYHMNSFTVFGAIRDVRTNSRRIAA